MSVIPFVSESPLPSKQGTCDLVLLCSIWPRCFQGITKWTAELSSTITHTGYASCHHCGVLPWFWLCVCVCVCMKMKLETALIFNADARVGTKEVCWILG